jgi:carbamoyltransferase
MKILGISGLPNAVPFKQKHWPGLEPREYRISQGHDAAAALIVDGEIIAAAAEERFSRKKHTGDFPRCAISYCLSEAGITLEEVDEIAHGFDYSRLQKVYSADLVSAELYRDVFSRQALLGVLRSSFPEFLTDRVHQVSHHLAHAASAYFTSGWGDCLVVVIDAMGELHSTSIFIASNGKLRKIKDILANDSIGILYSLLTLHLGFDFNADEYKIMGLAPYGDPARFRGFFEEAVELRSDGTVSIPILRLNKTRDERENYLRTREFVSHRLLPPREPEEEISDIHRDLAAALQECLNRVVIHICQHFGKSVGLRKLAMAGGVALNCAANGKLLQSSAFDEIYVQPAAGDDGTALGAALYRSSLGGQVVNRRIPVPFYGPQYGPDQVEAALRQFQDHINITRFCSLDKTCQEAAKLIAKGRVLAWYRGRMEFGPRALGNRSILADPANSCMRDRVNAMVKKREAFRPFAPAVSLEQVHLWFDVTPGTQLPYMIATADVREEHRAALPAITHVDGTARVQTVSKVDNSDFHTLLRRVGEITGKEIVLNTSFNIKGQPIVNTPLEAISTFLGTGIDFLFIENILISRRNCRPDSAQG